MSRPTLTPVHRPTPVVTPPPPPPGPRSRAALRVAIATVSCLLGLLLVAQVRATEDFSERLVVEREEDLTRILSSLADQREALSQQIAEQRLLQLELEVNSERRQIAITSLRERLDDLRVLTGTVPVVGDQGVRLTISDPRGVVSQDQVVDTIQELRDAGAEAIAVDDVRLVVQSAVTTANGRLVVDGHPLESPYRIEAIGPAEALAQGLAIPGGVETSLASREGVDVRIERLGEVSLPAAEPVPFVFAEPVPPGDVTG